MTDKQYYQFMLWHRGLAVPAARNLNDAQVKRGKSLFTEMGCAQCHRPSWKTGADNMWVDASTKAYAQSIGKDPSTMLPKYPNQVIWPYTDMVQHRLFMENDIRTGWCTTVVPARSLRPSCGMPTPSSRMPTLRLPSSTSCPRPTAMR